LVFSGRHSHQKRCYPWRDSAQTGKRETRQGRGGMIARTDIFWRFLSWFAVGLVYQGIAKWFGWRSYHGNEFISACVGWLFGAFAVRRMLRARN
jgi:hypothetical protein